MVLSLLLLVGSASLAGAASDGPPPDNGDPLLYPDAMPPIDVAVVTDGVDNSGRWTQTIRLTIRAGGTLGAASEIVYGDAVHINQVFAAAKKANPKLYSPASVPLGQVIDLTIDPTTTYALQSLQQSPSARVLHFTNGVVDTTYSAPHGGVQRVLTFPAGKPTQTFIYPGATGPLRVRPGGRIVDLQYVAGQSYVDTVRQVYGVTNFATAADLDKQTGWDPTAWPPALGERKRIILAPAESYQVVPTDAGFIPNPDPVGQAQLLALRQERARVGITTKRLDSFAEVFHVAVSDTSATASMVSTLLYGSPAHRADIARAAGFKLPDASGKAMAIFDPVLFGRAFDVSVDYVDEQFPVKRIDQSGGSVQLELANGTVLTSYPPQPSGPIAVVAYPTGYRRILYRPNKTLYTVAQGLALFHLSGDLTLPAGTADALTRDYVAQVIWQWGSGIPRRGSDAPDSLTLVDDQSGSYVVALISPPGPRTVVDQATDVMYATNPLRAIIILVVAASTLALALELTRRAVGVFRRPRW